MARRPITTADRLRGLGQPKIQLAAPQPTTVRGPSFKPFRPYKAPPIPTGLYDPALDAARGAATRGLQDTIGDAATQTLRDTVDYGLGRDQIQLAQDRGTQDITTQYQHGSQDLDTRAQALVRSFAQLQSRQGQQINAAGLGGGAVLQAAAKRQQAQQLEQGQIDTARQRLGDATLTAANRLNQDSDVQRGNLALELGPVSADNPLGGRRAQDRGTALTRAKREDTQFGIDTTAQKAFQAAGMDYVAPGRGTPGGMPKNEHVGPKGNPYRVVRRGGIEYRIRPDGSVATKRKVK